MPLELFLTNTQKPRGVTLGMLSVPVAIGIVANIANESFIHFIQQNQKQK